MATQTYWRFCQAKATSTLQIAVDADDINVGSIAAARVDSMYTRPLLHMGRLRVACDHIVKTNMLGTSEGDGIKHHHVIADSHAVYSIADIAFGNPEASGQSDNLCGLASKYEGGTFSRHKYGSKHTARCDVHSRSSCQDY
jgi:hypothetical protein